MDHYQIKISQLAVKIIKIGPIFDQIRSNLPILLLLHRINLSYKHPLLLYRQYNQCKPMNDVELSKFPANNNRLDGEVGDGMVKLGGWYLRGASQRVCILHGVGQGYVFGIDRVII
jgi:hypothetical protein